MSAETLLVEALAPLVASGKVYFNVAPLGSPTPRLVLQQAGGEETQFLDGTLASKEQPRIQVVAWALEYNLAKNLSQQAAQVICTSTALQGSPLGAGVSDYEPDTKLHGFRQDFLIAAER